MGEQENVGGGRREEEGSSGPKPKRRRLYRDLKPVSPPIFTGRFVVFLDLLFFLFSTSTWVTPWGLLWGFFWGSLSGLSSCFSVGFLFAVVLAFWVWLFSLVGNRGIHPSTLIHQPYKTPDLEP